MSQNQPPVAHNISTVVFLHSRESDHAPDLNVLFELTRDIPDLKLRRQDAIIAINKVDIRGMTKDVVINEDITRPQNKKLLDKLDGQLCIWDVLKHPYDQTFKRSRNIPYQASRTYGFCHKCPRGQAIHFMNDASKSRANFMRHVNSPHATGHIPHLNNRYLCENCNQEFRGARERQIHICYRFRDLDRPTRYDLLTENSASHGIVAELGAMDAYKICFEQRWAVSDCYPPLNVPLYLRKWPFSEWGNASKGQDFLFEALNEMWRLQEREDHLLLHKNLHIHRSGTHTIPLG